MRIPMTSGNTRAPPLKRTAIRWLRTPCSIDLPRSICDDSGSVESRVKIDGQNNTHVDSASGHAAAFSRNEVGCVIVGSIAFALVFGHPIFHHLDYPGAVRDWDLFRELHGSDGRRQSIFINSQSGILTSAEEFPCWAIRRAASSRRYLRCI